MSSPGKPRVAPRCAVLLAVGALARAETPDRPLDSGLVEETGRRLVQLDVTVTGPREKVEGLTAAELELVVGGRRIEEFRLDSLCRPEPAVPAAGAAPAEIEAAAAPRPIARFLFYFDQSNLTQVGRVRALELARDLIPELIQNGNLGTVVSNGRELRTYVDLSPSPAALLEALDRIASDPKQWDPSAFAFDEEQRVRHVIEELSEGDVTRATSLVIEYQREESWRIERSLRRLGLVMARMADVEAPKAVVYFADTMRANAGEHYLDLLGSSNREFRAIRSRVDMADSVFKNVIAEATANGLRLYTIQAEGLVALTPATNPSPTVGASPARGTGRIDDAQDSLVALARESGGQAFLNGTRSNRIVERILEDLSCMYLISFDAAALPENQTLRVLLRAARPGIETRVRGSVFIQDVEKRQHARLLAAFAAPNVASAGIPARGSVTPTGFEDGSYTALVQLAVPASPVPDATWDLGMSLVAGGRVGAEISGRVTLAAPGVPVVFEAEMEFEPGEFEVVGVAHETRANEVVTGQIDGSWPDPDVAPATVGPIALMQPFEGVFVRGGQVKRGGPIGLAADELVRADRAAVLISLVCRGRTTKGRLRVERRLAGETVAPFEPVDIDLSKEERCVQIRDVIPPAVMSAGAFAYEVHVLRDDEEVAVGRREFGTDGADPAPAAGAAPAPQGGP